MIVLFDLDGTLADHSYRLEHCYNADKPDWDLFEAECENDALIVPTAEVLIAFHNIGHRIWLWTGRSDAVRTATERWLSKHALPYRQLLMRPHGVSGDAADFKKRWAQDDPIPYDQILCAYDDDPTVIATLRAIGIHTYQVRKPE